MQSKLLKNNKKKGNNQQEKSTGRSMVEMLGVLAIIGVLSIGGIQGYSVAMRKYRANEVMNLATKYLTLEYTNCIQYRLNGSSGDSGMTATTDESGNTGIWRICPDPIEFSKTGLGALPKGVDNIYHWQYYLETTQSADILVGEIFFNDKNLCQIVESTFQSYKKGNTEINCDNNNTFDFYIYAN